jgi:hypothetical protein
MLASEVRGIVDEYLGN